MLPTSQISDAFSKCVLFGGGNLVSIWSYPTKSRCCKHNIWCANKGLYLSYAHSKPVTAKPTLVYFYPVRTQNVFGYNQTISARWNRRQTCQKVEIAVKVSLVLQSLKKHCAERVLSLKNLWTDVFLLCVAHAVLCPQENLMKAQKIGNDTTSRFLIPAFLPQFSADSGALICIKQCFTNAPARKSHSKKIHPHECEIHVMKGGVKERTEMQTLRRTARRDSREYFCKNLH